MKELLFWILVCFLIASIYPLARTHCQGTYRIWIEDTGECISQMDAYKRIQRWPRFGGHP